MIKKATPMLIANQIAGMRRGAPINSIFTSKFTYGEPGRTYNKKYWPHQYILKWDRNVGISDVEKWCWTHFKGRYWNSYRSRFVFKRSEDAIMFKLRWNDYCSA